MAALFTVFTIYYAFFILTNLNVFGVSLRAFVPPQLVFAERAEYVVLFTGWGLAVYYLDYARRQFGGERDDSAADGETDDDVDSEAFQEPPERVSLLDDLGLKSQRISSGIQSFKRVYGRFDPYLAIAFALLALVTMAYIYGEFSRLDGDAHILGFTTADHIVGAALIVLVTDATRRAFGWIIASVAIFAIVYSHAAVSTLPFLPDLLAWSGEDITGIVEEAALGVQSGIYDSTIMGIGSTWVAIFIMFAGIAKAYGLMEYIRSVGTELGNTLRTGVVQIAVISSMIMGSITGSAAANTATTGSFTIPMIQDQGVRDDYAASIEAVASAGGQMLPPVMGVAAFLMADIIGIPYLEVVQAGTIPAALFYLSVCLAVHFSILKFGWTTTDLSPFDWRVLLRGIHFVIPLFVLLYTLIVLRFTPLTAGFYTILTIIGVIFVRNYLIDVFSVDEVIRSKLGGGNARSDDPADESTRSIGSTAGGVGASSYRSLAKTSKQSVEGLYQGGIEMAPLVGVLAAMGLIVELLETSGLTGRLGAGIIGFADVSVLGFTGGLALVLVLAMIASIAFGLGMPTPAAYILVAFLIADAVTELAVPELTTHMFVFYFAMLSAITPPVAISVAVGSRIAGTSFMTACVQALRIGAPGFVIPFAFVANNSLIEWSSMTVFAFPVVLAGTIGLIVATVGFDGARELSLPVRTFYVTAGFAAMFGSTVAGTLGMAVQTVAAATIVLLLLRARYLIGYDIERVRGPSASDWRSP
ncbi:TRAP transporter fused permease subunit [Natronorubrum sp. JWXQ-INN-674]|uniref:TRAP transporter fused permease subunit n=1 Tax=Natronorubrum halalkaliphilum TaxID=2691917 RepID=A0A6B0VJQ1_9EURY|nr:TRAP transporter fused permease subunit [Natronorubrum halalkaliphilum]MXV61770.1 TRAP transporter fused permease subunit [Natronorubrum halalkaliphilum]